MKKKYELLRKNFAIPVRELKEIYEYSALSVENKLCDREVLRCFEKLDEALMKQLRQIKDRI